jgi:hypothetical protein
MAKFVEEIMSRELFSVRPQEMALDVLRFILALDITGAAVVDDERRPLGVVSIRDLIRAEGEAVASCMTTPAVTIPVSTSIDRAARVLAESGRHRLVVVDEDGRAAGMVSSIDILRGVLGLPALHPPRLSRFDAASGLAWTDDNVLEPEKVDLAPSGPGILVLIHGGVSIPERVVWAESCSDVRGRLRHMLSSSERPLSARALSLGQLRFRAASAPDPGARRRALEAVQGEAMAALHPDTPRGAA